MANVWAIYIEGENRGVSSRGPSGGSNEIVVIGNVNSAGDADDSALRVGRSVARNLARCSAGCGA